MGASLTSYSVPLNLPVGSIIPWAKTLTNTPALTSSWAECNGQTLSDAGSVYNGVTLPALNGNSEATKIFLRGSTTSGSTGGSMPQAVETGNTDFTPYNGVNSTNTVAKGVRPPPYYEVVFIIRVK